MIQHMVIFNLKHGADSDEERAFLKACLDLADIPDVTGFEVLKQTSSKNDYSLGLSMKFKTQEEYDSYCDHDIHQNFIQERWIPEVTGFQEIDLSLY